MGEGPGLGGFALLAVQIEVVWCSISSSPTADAEKMQRRRGGRLI